MREALLDLGPTRVGLSTGVARDGATWPDLAERALVASAEALELAGARDRDDLAALLAHLAAGGLPGAARLSVHAPAGMDAADVADLLLALPARVERVVAHPDRLGDPVTLAPLGSRLVLENMNARKADGRTAGELAAHFARFPEAGLCLDLAHVATVDPSLALADDLLAAHGGRLRQLHLSGSDASGGHLPLTTEDVARYAPVLRRCRGVPWILEREALPIRL
ncbi:MAG: hypothetical protein QOD86_1160 [Miltoncostaeaceae bacterium]|nr:hypothetical protein [Miltoncostaeaceae bacterium]